MSLVAFKSRLSQLRSAFQARRWSLPTAVLLGVAIGIVLWRQQSPAFPEVLSSELALRDGVLYHGAKSQPLTGFVLEKYSDGKAKSRSQVERGKLHGLSLGWHPNGNLQVREFFRNGVSHGLREKWFESGTKASEGHIVEGKHHGIFFRWHENGILAEEVHMQRGEPDGLARAFYPSGFLKAQAMMRNGEVVETKSRSDGEFKARSSLASSK